MAQNSLREQVLALTDGFMDEGPKIWATMPKKVIAFNRIYESLHHPDGQSPALNVQELSDLLKTHMLEFIDDIEALRLWITLKVPKIEDGNNFGVAVQADIIGILQGGKSSVTSILDSFSKHVLARAEILSKLRKYKGVEDYSRTVQEMEERQRMVLKHCCIDLRNNYAILYDIIQKNMPAILHPKGEAGSHRESLL
eukprot:TRINITY_DN6328_c0_g1_i1.p1 TRINITY_DN6328_c0_g1~~TRINITY_DN6328_c0_g1_i1.p1  ORF type:complete len:217 (-),score=39.63 TRINITY_DN6328_c0_g1_i1:128-718(-)